MMKVRMVRDRKNDDALPNNLTAVVFDSLASSFPDRRL